MGGTDELKNLEIFIFGKKREFKEDRGKTKDFPWRRKLDGGDTRTRSSAEKRKLNVIFE